MNSALQKENRERWRQDAEVLARRGFKLAEPLLSCLTALEQCMKERISLSQRLRQAEKRNKEMKARLSEFE